MEVCLYGAFGCDDFFLGEACARSSSATEGGVPNATFNYDWYSQQEVSSAVEENPDGVSSIVSSSWLMMGVFLGDGGTGGRGADGKLTHVPYPGGRAGFRDSTALCCGKDGTTFLYMITETCNLCLVEMNWNKEQRPSRTVCSRKRERNVWTGCRRIRWCSLLSLLPFCASSSHARPRNRCMCPSPL